MNFGVLEAQQESGCSRVRQGGGEQVGGLVDMSSESWAGARSCETF